MAPSSSSWLLPILLLLVPAPTSGQSRRRWTGAAAAARAALLLDPCGDIWINASKTPREAMPRAAWQACYASRAATLLGGYTMEGTNVFYDGEH